MEKLRQRIEDGSERVPQSGCWIWRKGCFTSGYGAIVVGDVTKLTHRVSYEAFVGPIEKGMMVLHRCDVKPCVNPHHLYVGDGKQNCKDAIERGQKPSGARHWRKRNPDLGAKGEKAGKARLTEEIIRFIRQSDESHAELGRKFGVTLQNVWRIRNRKSWKHVV